MQYCHITCYHQHFFHQHTFEIAWTPGHKKGLFSLDSAQFDNRNIEKIQSRYLKRRLRHRWRIMDLCLWARNKTAIDRVGLWRRAKSNKCCSKQMVACLFFKTGHVAWVVHHNLFAWNFRIIVHHDNASSPYSSDLAPNDYFLFPHIVRKRCNKSEKSA